MVSRVFSAFGGRAAHFLFGGVFIGLLLPDLAALARPLLMPSVAMMLLLTLLRVDWAVLHGHSRRIVTLGLAISWILLLAPLVTWLALVPNYLPPDLSTAVVLMAAAPPIIGATSIAIFLKLDGELALITTLIATFLVPFTLPPLALELLNLKLNFSAGEFMLRLGGIVGFSTISAIICRRLFGRARIEKQAQAIDGAIVALMLVFAIAIMDGVTETLINNPMKVLIWTGVAFIANPILQLLAYAGFIWRGNRHAKTLALLSGNRNMGLVLAALPPASNEGILLFFALAQLPMYMLPTLLQAFYRGSGDK